MPSFFKKVVSSLVTIALLIPYSLPNVQAKGVDPEEKVYFYLQDHLGSVDVIVDENGNVVERQDYLPYGNERAKTPTDSTHQEDYGFTGKELDEETDLMYYGARYYDPMIGRFTSVDPVVMGEAKESNENIESIIRDPQMLNGYTYAANNPLKYIDPTGEAWVDWLVGTAYAPAQDGQKNDFASINISNQCRSAESSPFSIGLEMAPGIGDANDVYSAITGKSAVTDAPLSASERAFSAIAAPLPIVTGGLIGRVFKEVADQFTPLRKLPVDKHGIPIPDTSKPHTQLGIKSGRKGDYRQTLEWQKDGKPYKKVDWTDHGRIDHANPHQGRYLENETGGTMKRGGNEPFSPSDPSKFEP